MKKFFKMFVGYSACVAVQLVFGLLCTAVTTPIIDWISNDDKLD